MSNVPRIFSIHGLLINAFRAVVVVAFCTVPHMAHAGQRLDVRISSPYLHDRQRASIIHVELANVGDEDISIFLWETPFVQIPKGLARPLFDITDSVGKRVDYIGRSVSVKRVDLTSFITLHPGEIRSRDVDLRHEYDFGNGGAFAVRYTVRLTHEPDLDVVGPEAFAAFHRNTLEEATSNETIILIDGPVARPAPPPL
ncbi:hypothetical protein KPL74_00995 [Bacillus sp. NP157]|nr:hypothetical protein KPL74_00995 [Bacillus sp. NP157]